MPLKKRVVLIETKSSHIHVYSFAHIPRLGAVLLGTILRDKGYHVDVFIEDLGDVDMDVVRRADLVGISLITATAPQSYELAARIRALGIPVVLGGAHVSFVPEEAIRHADYILTGEADETMGQFVDALFDGGDLASIPGIWFRRDGEVVQGPPSVRPEDLDSSPFPDFSLVRAPRLSRIASVSTSRGCPFDCSFCSVTTFNGRKFRMRSVEGVVDEIDYQVRNHRFHYVFFADDIFNANKKRMVALVETMMRRGVTPAWGAQMRHEVTKDEDVVALLARGNCKQAFVGFESINPRALLAYNKKQTVDDIERSIDVFHRHGILVHGMFVVGCDEDSVETIRETVRFCQDRMVDSVQFMCLTPLPGSRDYVQFATGARELLSKRWDLYDGHHALHQPRRMTAYELQVESMRAMKRFYSLGRVFSRLARGRLTNAWIGAVGWKLVRQWHKDPDNHNWAAQLKEQLKEQARVLAGGAIPVGEANAVALVADESAAGLRGELERYFRALGARVEVVAGDLSARAGETRQHVAERAGDTARQAADWLKNLSGRVQFVVAPKAIDLEAGRARLAEELERLRANARARVEDLPRVLHIPDQVGDVRTWLVQVGLIFTDDIERIRLACAQVLEYLESQQVATQTG